MKLASPPIRANTVVKFKANDIHARLYPEQYGHNWRRVPFPERHIAFGKWWDGTNLKRLLDARTV